MEIHARLFVPDAEPRGCVSYVHGLQSHSGWFRATGTELAAAGFLALFADRRGSGRNPRDQAGRSDPQVMLDDVAEVLQQTHRIGAQRGVARDRPLGLIGHSFGGLLATSAVCLGRARVDWLYLISPGLAQKDNTKRVGRVERLATTCKVFLAPRRSVAIRIPPWALTDSPAGRNFVRRDPLRLQRIEARFFRAAGFLHRQLRQHASATPCPALLVLAGADELVDNRRTRQAFERLFTGRRQVRIFDGCGHTLELTAARDELVPELTRFLSGSPAQHPTPTA